MNTRELPTRHFLFSCVVATLASFFVTAPASAESGSDKIDEITRLICQDSGKIVMCVGQNPSSCTEIVRPFVEKCEQEGRNIAEKDRAQRFDECFHRDFYGKFGKKVSQNPVCVSYPEEEGAIQPPPPEFADKGTPFPFGQPLPEETPNN